MHIALTYNGRPEGVPPAGEVEDQYEEFDPPSTIADITTALAELGHTVTPLAADASLPRHLLPGAYDLVFNIAEGVRGGRARESLVPALCELVGLDYTGADPICLGLTLDKWLGRRVAAAEVPVAPGILLERPADAAAAVAAAGLRYPVIAKPNLEGSSKGIRRFSRAADHAALRAAVAWLFAHYGGPVLVEEFVAGPEVTAAVFGRGDGQRDGPGDGQREPEVAALMRIRPRDGREDTFLYSLEVKRDWARLIDYEVPPRLAPAALAALADTARRAYRLLGCRDLARVDMRLAADGRAVFIEANPLPGLSATTGDFVIALRQSGWSYRAIIERILAEAIARRDRVPAAFHSSAVHSA